MVIFQKMQKTGKNAFFPRDPPSWLKRGGGRGGYPPPLSGTGSKETRVRGVPDEGQKDSGAF